MLDKLKVQYQKLGEEIENLENSKPETWCKIFAPMWSDGKGNTLRYEISYILQSELCKVQDYKILETYSDKGIMLNSIQ